uniref:O-methyltransferase C-terminal domain-containing protein n=1 Tax=Nelumbo nucifera TaxID=4432 RepID=A0A822Z2D0_NELNU|nr:TPA_asm: hypothetical protein HUJ06_013505 [Nelumbo nucifera]
MHHLTEEISALQYYSRTDLSVTNSGVEHLGGDMFEYVPKADAIFMKCILHDWNDKDCLKLLKNCWKALPNLGMVIAVESILLILSLKSYGNMIWSCYHNALEEKKEHTNSSKP